jgi:hypothetical protein
MEVRYRIIDMDGEPVTLTGFSALGSVDLEILDVRLSVGLDDEGTREDVLTYTLLFPYDRMQMSTEDKLAFRRRGMVPPQ